MCHWRANQWKCYGIVYWLRSFFFFFSQGESLWIKQQWRCENKIVTTVKSIAIMESIAQRKVTKCYASQRLPKIWLLCCKVYMPCKKKRNLSEKITQFAEHVYSISFFFFSLFPGKVSAFAYKYCWNQDFIKDIKIWKKILQYLQISVGFIVAHCKSDWQDCLVFQTVLMG